MTDWLIDKSAPVRLYSARSGADLRADLRKQSVSAMPVEYPTPVIEDRAVEVLTLLADRGQYRAPSVPDPIIAAELAGGTGQPAEWLIAN